jgi:hypothetical protein
MSPIFCGIVKEMMAMVVVISTLVFGRKTALGELALT